MRTLSIPDPCALLPADTAANNEEEEDEDEDDAEEEALFWFCIFLLKNFVNDSFGLV